MCYCYPTPPLVPEVPTKNTSRIQHEKKFEPHCVVGGDHRTGVRVPRRKSGHGAPVVRAHGDEGLDHVLVGDSMQTCDRMCQDVTAV